MKLNGSIGETRMNNNDHSDVGKRWRIGKSLSTGSRLWIMVAAAVLIAVIAPRGISDAWADSNPQAITVYEGGEDECAEATYDIWLDADPGTNVTVGMNWDNTLVDVNPANVSFTAGADGTWADPQTITVTALDNMNPDPAPHTTTISHTAGGITDVVVTIVDDDGGAAATLTIDGDANNNTIILTIVEISANTFGFCDPPKDTIYLQVVMDGLIHSRTKMVDVSDITINLDGSGTSVDGGNDTVDASALLNDPEADPPLIMPPITIFGGTGNDTLLCGDGTDTINGGPGDDLVRGGGGGDTINGGDGDDTLEGGAGADTINGDADDDVLRGDAGSDSMDGGTGTNTVDYSTDTGENGVTVNLVRDIARDGFGDQDTLSPTNADSFLIVIGSPRDDVLIAENLQNTTIYGGDGDDTIYGGGRSDTLYGEAGDDTIFGGGWSDVIYGGDGDDALYGGDDDDFIYGGDGDDAPINGDDGDDEIHGGDGDDGTPDNPVSGGPGDDLIFGDAGDDILHGDDGEDDIFGGSGSDIIEGGAGDDVLNGGDDDDEIAGGGDNDVVIGGPGGDKLGGGGGYDVLDYCLSPNGVIVDFSVLPGTAEDGYIPSSTDEIGSAASTSFEAIRGSSNNDRLIGHTNLTTTILGGYGNDVIIGGGKSDLFFGEEGNDTIYGYKIDEEGNPVDDVATDGDSLFGGAGNDWIYGGRGADTICGDGDLPPVWPPLGIDAVVPITAGTYLPPSITNPVIEGAGNDNIYGGRESDTIYGGGGSDRINGDEESDTLFGDFRYDRDGDGIVIVALGDLDLSTTPGGSDYIYGGDGTDWIWGGAGSDVLVGGVDITGYSTGDTINGGPGNDRIIGGDTTLDDDGFTTGVPTAAGDEDPDIVDYSWDPAGVIADLGSSSVGLASGYAVDGYGGYDIIYGIEDLIGSDYDDVLTGTNDLWSEYGALSNGNSVDVERDGLYILYVPYVNVILGRGGDDTITGRQGEDYLIGGDGNDTIYGDMGDPAANPGAEDAGEPDHIEGNAGDDALYGQGGDDTIFGGTGADTMSGGTGEDTLNYSDFSLGVVVNLQSGPKDLYALEQSLDKFLPDRFDPQINDLPTPINASGQRVQAGLTATDGGVGVPVYDNDNDEYDYAEIVYTVRPALDTIISTSTDRFEIVVGTTTRDVIYANESAPTALYGGSGDDILIGGAGNDRVYGEEGDDILEGGGGDDTLIGGEDIIQLVGGGEVTVQGNDAVSYLSASSGVTVRLSSVAPQNTGGAGIDTIEGCEDLIGSAYNDDLMGNAGPNVIVGGPGDDILNGRGDEDIFLNNAWTVTSDRLDGGDGYDVVDYRLGDPQFISVALYSPCCDPELDASCVPCVASDDGEGGSDILVSIEDFLSPPSGRLFVYAGKDVVISPGGSAVLKGEAKGGEGGYTYKWDTVPPVVPPAGTPECSVVIPGLDDRCSIQPTASPEKTTEYSLAVTDGMGRTGIDFVTVAVAGTLVVDAGPDRSITLGDLIQLAGSASGGVPPYTVLWTPIAGLSSTSTLIPNASPTVTTTYTLTVTDSYGQQQSDTVVVRVMSPSGEEIQPSEEQPGGDQGETEADSGQSPRASRPDQTGTGQPGFFEPTCGCGVTSGTLLVTGLLLTAVRRRNHRF